MTIDPKENDGATMTSDERLRDYLKRVTVDLHDTRRRLREAERQTSEPLAIVGMGCRYPGGIDSPERLWEVASAERDVIAGFPSDRGWESGMPGGLNPERGLRYAREGGFLYDAANFDADFFSISPKEAVMMDPQQRLLLETSWAAIENASIDMKALSGSQTGVFVGAAPGGYGLAFLSGEKVDADGYSVMGNAPSILSGRISYAFGLEGPAMTVDTACSSSLVALHLASEVCEARECSLALVGGCLRDVHADGVLRVRPPWRIGGGWAL